VDLQAVLARAADIDAGEGAAQPFARLVQHADGRHQVAAVFIHPAVYDHAGPPLLAAPRLPGDLNGANNKRYRPISLAKTQESHVLQIRQDMDPEVACVQWLAMGVASQSIYVPFYMGMTDTPEDYKIGELPYDSKSAYWTYKLAGVLLDGHYKELGKDYQAKQKDINITLRNMLRDFDMKALSKDSEELPEFLTDASFKMAKTSMDAYKELIAQLITDSTNFSPLNFKTDMNL